MARVVLRQKKSAGKRVSDVWRNALNLEQHASAYKVREAKSETEYKVTRAPRRTVPGDEEVLLYE